MVAKYQRNVWLWNQRGLKPSNAMLRRHMINVFVNGVVNLFMKVIWVEKFLRMNQYDGGLMILLILECSLMYAQEIGMILANPVVALCTLHSQRVRGRYSWGYTLYSALFMLCVYPILQTLELYVFALIAGNGLGIFWIEEGERNQIHEY